ncbi:MAG: DUF4138 domain-containing protein [Daejeonella sp.]
MRSLIINILLYLLPITVLAQGSANYKDSVFQLSNVPEKPVSLSNTCAQIVKSRNFQTIRRDKSGRMNSKLGRIAISADTMFYRIKIKNKSNINYDIDFIRFYLRDIKTAKRTVTQEQEVFPIYSYGLDDGTIEGQRSIQYVFALNKVPLSKDKALFIELYEKDGSRHMYLKAEGTDLENARLIR